MAVASGTFEVNLVPLGPSDSTDGVSLGKMSIDKRFGGDLEGTTKGEMLTAITGVEGSAVYVAIERVTGTLAGRSGTFTLHHTGIMTRGVQQLSIGIVPDSGTGGLAGIAGTMEISIVEGKHSYTLQYTLGD